MVQILVFLFSLFFFFRKQPKYVAEMQKIHKITKVNPVAKIIWQKRTQVIPNKKKKIPRKQKYKGSGSGRFFYA